MVGPCQRFLDFEKACQAEMDAILRHKPVLNIRVISTRGFLGKHTTRGKKKSEETKLRMRKPKSDEHRANMRKPKSPEHRAKLAAACEIARSHRRFHRGVQN